MTYTEENFTREEVVTLIKTLLDTDLNNYDTACFIMDFVEFYCKKRIATAKELLKAGRPQWHKVAAGDLPNGDEGYGKTSINRKIYLKDRDGNLYTGRYYPKDESHPEDCFAVDFLDWGLQGAHFCAKVQISEWCEVPVFDKE